MGILRGSNKEASVKALIAALQGQLLDTDENYAESYVNWCIQKLQINKEHCIENHYKKLCKTTQIPAKIQMYRKEIARVKHHDLPRDIKKGDIVHTIFGINLGDELSDLDKQQQPLPGHYSIVLAQLGFMFLVVPLTSRAPIWNVAGLELSYRGLGLPGVVPAEESHVLFSQIQRIHIRRIKRIHGLSEGKVSLNNNQIIDLDKRLSILFSIKF